ncbi:22780_t:CDS:1, partial [Gigaspora margarita]
LNANYIDLIYSTAIKHPTDIPPPPTIYITDSLASTLFYDNEARQKLCQIA